jgi:prolyl-tRNA synthetase
VIVGPRGLEKGLVEVKSRKTGAREELSLEAVMNQFGA